MMKHRLRLAAAIALPWLAVAACATDNGSNVFGDQFAPPGKKLDAGGTPDPVPGTVDDAGDDGGTDAPPDAPSVGCTGTGTIAVLAGDDASLSGSLQVNGGAWTGGALTGGAAKSVPAIAPFGAGFVAVTRGPLDALEAVSVGATFADPTAIGSAKTLASPALAIVGTTAHVAYLDASNKFFHGTNTGAGWDSANDPVQPPAGTQSFGPSAPAIAAAGTDLVFAQTGGDQGLYWQSLSGGTWSAPAAVSGAGTYNTVPPALVSVSGTNDLVMLYATITTSYIAWTGRSASGKTWGAPAYTTNTIALTKAQMSVAAIGSSTLLLSFRGDDGNAYLSTGTISGASITWTSPSPIVAGGVAVDSVPAVAKGVCGDDAILVFASSGVVKATRLRGTTWSSPETVTGASGSRVAVATK